MANHGSYVNLLHSQTPIDLDSAEPIWFGDVTPDEPGVESVKERRRWSPKEDKILIGAWLNTSKDPVVSTSQKIGAFWQRILDSYNSSPQLVGTADRELRPLRQRWQRINGEVGKFVGCFEAAQRDQRSGQNDDDVMKAALDMFYNDHKLKFTLEHAWRELRHEQKWCASLQKEKRKQVFEVDGEDEVGEGEERPIGVKAAKAAGKKKKTAREEELSQLQGLMEIKQKISNQKLLARLLGREDTLSELETTLKLKLMSEMI